EVLVLLVEPAAELLVGRLVLRLRGEVDEEVPARVVEERVVEERPADGRDAARRVARGGEERGGRARRGDLRAGETPRGTARREPSLEPHGVLVLRRADPDERRAGAEDQDVLRGLYPREGRLAEADPRALHAELVREEPEDRVAIPGGELLHGRTRCNV